MCASAVHVVRDNVVDVVLFVGTGALIVVLLRRDLPGRPPPGWLARRWPAVGAAAVVGVVVASEPRESGAVQVVLAAVGVVALVLVLRAGAGSPRPEPRVAARTGVWVALLLAGCVVELGDFLSQPDAQTDNPDHPTLSAMVDPMLGTHPTRAAVAVVWVLLGWGLVRLLTERPPGARGVP